MQLINKPSSGIDDAMLGESDFLAIILQIRKLRVERFAIQELSCAWHMVNLASCRRSNPLQKKSGNIETRAGSSLGLSGDGRGRGRGKSCGESDVVAMARITEKHLTRENPGQVVETS